MKSSWNVKSLNELSEVASELLKNFSLTKVFCLRGEMAAGKTTFIKELCKCLGVENGVSSPTFSLVNEYVGNDGQIIYHFDFYRIKNEEEAFDLGYEEYIYSGNYCFIEWPERIENLLNLPKADIFITLESTTRQITCNYE